MPGRGIAISPYMGSDAGGPASPQISVNATSLTNFLGTAPGQISSSASYQVSGSNLIAPIIITAPSGFIINTNNSNTDQNPISLNPVGGLVSSTTIYVKFAPIIGQYYSGSIQHTSSGATSKFVFVSGSSVIGALTNFHRFYGDSISIDEASYSAAGHCISGDGGYTTRVAVAKGITGEWHALGSTTISYHITQAYQYTDIQSNESASYMGGINNIRGDGNNLTELEGMLSGGLVAILSVHFAKAIRKLSTEFTQAGSGWIVGAVVTPNYSGQLVSSNNIGDTLTGTFNGDAFSINSYYNNLGTYGYEIRVDGVLKKTVSITNLSTTTTGGSSGAASPYAVVVSGCGAGAHTVEIKIIAGSGTQYVHFDSLFELADVSDAYIQPFVWLQIPHANTNYWGTDNAPFNQGSNAIVDSCNSAMETEIAFFKGYSKFGIVRTNDWYNADDPAQGSTADGPYALHPGCLGSQNIADGFEALVNSYSAPSQHALLTTWLSGLTGAQPSADQIYSLNYALMLFDQAGIITEADLLHFIAGLGTDEQRLKPLKTTGVSPFTSTDSLQNVGAAGNGSTFTNLKWKPATHGSKYTQNSASFFVYNHAQAKASAFLFGAWNDGANAVGLSPQSGGIYASMNAAVYQFSAISFANSRGMIGIQRTASNSSKMSKEGLVIATSTTASTALVNLDIYVNGLDESGSVSLRYAGQVGFVLAGSGNIDHQRVDSIFKWYKRRNGF